MRRGRPIFFTGRGSWLAARVGMCGWLKATNVPPIRSLACWPDVCCGVWFRPARRRIGWRAVAVCCRSCAVATPWWRRPPSCPSASRCGNPGVYWPPPLVGILCGAVNYPIGSGLRRGLTAKLLSGLHPVLFAEAEKAELLRRFGPREISVGWFGVDEEFWTPPSAPASRRGVLAVGNDGRRDYNTLVQAARALPDETFRIITRLEPPVELPANVEWSRGDWREQAVSDEDLRELYQSAACVVVPLAREPAAVGSKRGHAGHDVRRAGGAYEDRGLVGGRGHP